eukprot:SAG22_NODE_3115_length_1928_cov_1.236741_2_plen_143_part_00
MSSLVLPLELHCLRQCLSSPSVSLSVLEQAHTAGIVVGQRLAEMVPAAAAAGGGGESSAAAAAVTVFTIEDVERILRGYDGQARGATVTFVFVQEAGGAAAPTRQKKKGASAWSPCPSSPRQVSLPSPPRGAVEAADRSPLA